MKAKVARYVPATALALSLAFLPVASSGLAQSESDTYAELQRFASIFREVRANYVDTVDDKTLIKGAIDGMLAALDPHSGYSSGTEYSTLRTSIDGSYGGLGMTVSAQAGAIRVVAASEDGPADKAGIKPGDFITDVDGEYMYGFSVDEAAEKMRGVPGSKVNVRVIRAGREAPIELTLTREKIDLKPVKWETRGNVGIININSFSAPTGALTRQAIAEIDKKTGGRTIGYIVDLRNNPGGLLDQAVEVSDAFLGRVEIVSQRGRRKSETQRYYAEAGDLTNGKPIIVLIDAGSASASEIVAGALQDYHRALIIGDTSFGKGSVQSVFDVGDRAALRLTTARYYTPSGHSIQAGGITPDIKVPQLSDPDVRAFPTRREADLRRHLISRNTVDDALLEMDEIDDPRFKLTAAELEKAGIEDFQLQYALDMMKTIATASPVEMVTKRASGTKG